MKADTFRCFILMALALPFTNAFAGPYGDKLGNCLVESTSQRDRNILIVWMFSAASQHPVVRNILNVSPEQMDLANKNMADLTVKLLTENCKVETSEALKNEGATALESSFRLFGQVAGNELFTSPHVAGALAGFEKHLDSSKIEELMR